MNQSTLNAAKRRMTVSPPPNLAQKAAQGAMSLANKFGKATYDQPSKFPTFKPPKTPTQQIAAPPTQAAKYRKGRGRPD